MRRSDLEHHTDGRLTFDASQNGGPVWSPDGAKVAFSRGRGAGGFLYQHASNGAGQDELLLESKSGKWPWDWSRDGRFLIFGEAALPNGFDLGLCR